MATTLHGEKVERAKCDPCWGIGRIAILTGPFQVGLITMPGSCWTIACPYCQGLGIRETRVTFCECHPGAEPFEQEISPETRVQNESLLRRLVRR